MAKLYKYPLNSAWSTQTHFGYMTPLYYRDTLPGERWNGHIRVKFMTDSLIKAALNRMWFDCFAFYVPFRLMSDDFAPWLAGDDTVAATAIPTTATTWPWNWEGAIVGNGHTENAAWQRYMYNRVWNDVFRDEAQAERVVSAQTQAVVLNRARSFQNILKDSPPSQTVGTTIQAFKDNMATYRQERFEHFFAGAEAAGYLDVLRRFGVEPGFEVDDGPRLIGQYHAQGSFEMVVSTGDTEVGSPSGFWAGSIEMDFGSKLIPEHGLIGIYAVPRLEMPFQGFSTTPLCQKCDTSDRSDYFTVEEIGRSAQAWSDKLWQPFVAAPGYNKYVPAWEDYRTPVSQMYTAFGGDTGAPPDDNYALVVGNSAINNLTALDGRDASNVSGVDFWRKFAGAVGGEICIYTEVTGDRFAPVPPRQRNV